MCGPKYRHGTGNGMMKNWGGMTGGAGRVKF